MSARSHRVSKREGQGARSEGCDQTIGQRNDGQVGGQTTPIYVQNTADKSEKSRPTRVRKGT